MIISASRRTDIPAFYSRWFFNRLDAGFCEVPHPFNAKLVYRIELTPGEVDAIVFWTRNPAPMLGRLPELDDRGYRYYFQYTLTPYGHDLDPFTPALDRRIETFLKLSHKVGFERVVWRNDPIIVSDKTDFDFHLRSFSQLARKLAGHTEQVTISLVEFYRKVDWRLRALEQQGWVFEREVRERPEFPDFLAALAKTAQSAGMRIAACADAQDYSKWGIKKARCVDGALINRLWGLEVSCAKDPGQRADCLCAKSRDIGVMDTCLHGCLYCYSTCGHDAAKRRFALHDPHGPALWKRPDEFCVE